MFAFALILGVIGAVAASSQPTTKAGFSYDDLPSESVFPGPWDEYIQAPANKTHIRPTGVKHVEGDVSNAEALLDGVHGSQNVVLGPGGLVIFDFGQNIAGR